ncbi:unnamed protein product, partial [Nesidiocoris tenuis]
MSRQDFDEKLRGLALQIKADLVEAQSDLLVQVPVIMKNSIPSIIESVTKQVEARIGEKLTLTTEALFKEMDERLAVFKENEVMENTVRLSKVYSEIKTVYDFAKNVEKNMNQHENNPSGGSNRKAIEKTDENNKNPQLPVAANITKNLTTTSKTIGSNSTTENITTRDSEIVSPWFANHFSSEKCQKFADFENNSPFEFIEQLEFEYNSFGKFQRLKYFVGSRLDGRARAWMLLREFTTWDQFKKAFIEEFCGSKYTTFVTSQLYAGNPLDPMADETENKILKLVVQLRETGIQLPEDVIVQLVSKQLGPEVEMVANLHQFKTIDLLLDYIRRLKNGQMKHLNPRTNFATRNEVHVNNRYPVNNWRPPPRYPSGNPSNFRASFPQRSGFQRNNWSQPNWNSPRGDGPSHFTANQNRRPTYGNPQPNEPNRNQVRNIEIDSEPWQNFSGQE